MKRLALPLIALVMTTGVSPDPKLTEHQRAVHVLNRLAFGPRPGDVDKVLKDGIDVWIDQQLHPDAIPARAVEARLQHMPTLPLINGAIMDAYYKPLVQARRARKAEDATADTPELKEMRQKGRDDLEDLVAQRIIRPADSDRHLN